MSIVPRYEFIVSDTPPLGQVVPVDNGELCKYADHVVAVAAAREDAYQKGRDHGWALSAECCGSCPGECAQQVALRQMKEEGRT